MFDSIESVRETRKRYNAELFRSGVPTFRKFEEMEAEALAAGAVPAKYKELVALGISIAQDCLGCVEYHVSSALAAGATEAEVAEAAAVAVCIGGGSCEWPARYAFKVMDELRGGGSL